MNDHNSFFLGLDVSDLSTSACILGGDGKVVRQFQFPTTERALDKELRRQSWAGVAFEAGTHAPWMHRVAVKAGIEPVVANPRQVALITRSHRKSDENDAYLLAKLLRADRELLSPVTMRSKASADALLHLRARDTLVQMRTKAVNTVRGLVKSAGFRVPTGTATWDFAAAVLKLALPPEIIEPLRPLVDQIQSLSDAIDKSDLAIATLSDRLPVVARLKKIGGVGPIIAFAFVLVIDDPHRFPDSRTVGAYLGLTPRRDQSGTVDKQLSISKAGNGFLRRLLNQGAHSILRENSKDTTLRRRGQRIIARGGPRAKKRAVTAVSRGLAVLMHKLWVSEEPWEPLHGAPESIPSVEPAVAGVDLPRSKTGDCDVRPDASSGPTSPPSVQHPPSDPTMHRAASGTQSANRSLNAGKVGHTPKTADKPGKPQARRSPVVAPVAGPVGIKPAPLDATAQTVGSTADRPPGRSGNQRGRHEP